MNQFHLLIHYTECGMTNFTKTPNYMLPRLTFVEFASTDLKIFWTRKYMTKLIFVYFI